jgi:hypothetical protein
VDGNGGSCVRQATPGGYADAQACGSFNAAYQAASKGDLVLVKAGTYGTQSFSRKAALASGPYSVTPDGSEVRFRPESGTVTVNDININDGADQTTFIEHITFEDIDSEYGYYVNGGRDIHFVRPAFRGEGTLDHSSYASFQDCDVGGWTDANARGSDGFEWGEGFHYVLVEGCVFHDILTDNGVAHPDAVSINNFAGDCSNFTARRNRFYNNDIINWRGGCDGMVVENNFFGQSNHAFTVQLHGDDAVIRFNTIEGDIQNTGSGESDRQRWTGNIVAGPGSSCPNSSSSGVVSQLNVWRSRPITCGGAANNAQVASFTGYFVSLNPNGPTGSDLHLSPTAVAALSKVPGSSGCVADDIDREARSTSASCDAGADERAG